MKHVTKTQAVVITATAIIASMLIIPSVNAAARILATDILRVYGKIHNPTGPVVIADDMRVEGALARNAGPLKINDGLLQLGSGQVSFSGNVDAKAGLDVTGGDLSVGGSAFTVNATSGLIGSASVNSASIVDGGVAAADITDVDRAVSFPLRSFYDCQTNAGADIDFGEGGGDALPDFINSSTDGLGMVLRFDDTGSDPDQNSEVCNTFTVPPDYASGGEFRIRALKDAHAGASEVINCAASINGQTPLTAGTVTTTASASTSYSCSPTLTGIIANDSVSFYLSITSADSIDDKVDIASVEFVYTATQ